MGQLIKVKVTDVEEFRRREADTCCGYETVSLLNSFTRVAVRLVLVPAPQREEEGAYTLVTMSSGCTECRAR